MILTTYYILFIIIFFQWSAVPSEVGEGEKSMTDIFPIVETVSSDPMSKSLKLNDQSEERVPFSIDCVDS